MADALETIWKDMHQETPQEFVGGQRHHSLLVLVLIVLVSETDLSIFQLFQPVIGDRDGLVARFATISLSRLRDAAGGTRK